MKSTLFLALSLLCSSVVLADQSFEKLEQEAFAQINQYRASQNLPPLQFDVTLYQVAQEHSQNMASGKTPFGHKDFKQRYQQITRGSSGKRASENVAKNTYAPSQTVQRAVQSWIKSSGHRKNILGNYRKSGLAIARSKEDLFYFTQIFMN
ncbi:MAG: CAP domain-containing protein [Verrucomicrobiota bacterium]